MSHSMAFFLVGFLLLQYPDHTRSLKVMPDPSPSFGQDELRYVVGINSEGQGGGGEMMGPSRSIVMTSSDGTPHKCLIPLEKEDLEIADGSDTMTESDGSLKVPEEDNIWSYLDRLSTLCFYRSEGWWVFELCYGAEIKQSHEDKDESMNLEYVLGRFDQEEDTVDVIQEEKVNGKVKRFISQHYFDGDVCEQTGSPREAEVRYYCEERSQINYTSLVAVTEGPTCHYVVTVNTPLLCKHPAFKLQDPTRVILCNSMDEEKEIEQETENSNKNPATGQTQPKHSTTETPTETQYSDPSPVKDEL
ncbi:hypothetical protein BSKO_09693 [Bryopsis sp. KO-2023]|nr:hypothetical protein BSKO_09693 [Bryopsis sp. KO-2023]